MSKHNRKAVENAAYTTLKDIGMNTGNAGFKYIIEAVGMLYESKDNDIELTGNNGIYDKIADAHKKTPSSVERCIRHSIHLLRNEPDFEKDIKLIIGKSETNFTNKSFLYAILHYIEFEILS